MSWCHVLAWLAEIYEGMQLPEIYQSSVENKNEAGEIPVKTPTEKGAPTFGKQSAVQVGPDLECEEQIVGGILETRVLKKSKRAKVVFRRCVYTETAFSSAGKYSVSYRLKYIASTNGKSSPNAAKRSQKEASSAEGIPIDASNSDE
ncbi:hypothetical protein D5086_029344 [Populus alba]|uniref:Uncharacterized protein n=2 Tax=Populus TaxID=3689 RepID=A0ACC4AT92_POPAL|nr:hypothetical protein POTOM_051716 [Populus tomentosa]